MTDGKPEKIHLILDEWHIDGVGKFADGRLVWAASQFAVTKDEVLDFVCTFIFDIDGNLVDHTIDFVGRRGEYSQERKDRILDQHADTLEKCELTDIWIRPFLIDAHGLEFGLIHVPPNEPSDEQEEEDDVYGYDHWRVEFMPGNTLSFYAPWEDGGYDT